MKGDLSWTLEEVRSPQLFKVRERVTGSQKKIPVFDLAGDESCLLTLSLVKS